MIELVQRLIDRGHAYEVDGDVYLGTFLPQVRRAFPVAISTTCRAVPALTWTNASATRSTSRSRGAAKPASHMVTAVGRGAPG